MTNTQIYWNDIKIMVVKKEFTTAKESAEWLDYRNGLYPLFAEYMDLNNKRNGQIIVDYGCGPGNDLVWFGTKTGATKIYGIDISGNALEMAKRRIALHGIGPERIKIIKVDDSPDMTINTIPDESIDFVYSEGVLHHTIFFRNILYEFRRIMKKGAEARIMVYNRNSLWYHLYVGYICMVLQNMYSGYTANQVCGSTTDGPNCPVAMFFYPDDFMKECGKFGFTVEYLGGYFAQQELNFLNQYGINHAENEKLNPEHREFFKELKIMNNYPTHNGKTAGIGGCYLLRK